MCEPVINKPELLLVGLRLKVSNQTLWVAILFQLHFKYHTLCGDFDTCILAQFLLLNQSPYISYHVSVEILMLHQSISPY